MESQIHLQGVLSTLSTSEKLTLPSGPRRFTVNEQHTNTSFGDNRLFVLDSY